VGGYVSEEVLFEKLMFLVVSTHLYHYCRGGTAVQFSVDMMGFQLRRQEDGEGVVVVAEVVVVVVV
jgi:hypothetical protein